MTVRHRFDCPSLADRVTVVVLTHNRVTEVVRTIAKLLALPERPRVVIADNASTDSTVAWIDMLFPHVDVVQCLANRGAAGRNCAVARVTTDYVAFCDDDAWWEPGSLTEAVRVLDAAPDIAILGARVLTSDSRKTDPVCALMENSLLWREDLPGPLLTGYMAGACVMRTTVFRAVGGYEPRFFIGGEEELVALDVLAAGYAIVYLNSLTVCQEPSPTRDSGLRRRMLARNAAWIGWLRLPYGEACRLTWRALLAMSHEGSFIHDTTDMLRALPWALAHRRLIPRAVREMRRTAREAEHRTQPAERTAQNLEKHDR